MTVENMKKICEIPIYHLTREAWDKKAYAEKGRDRENYMAVHSIIDEEHFNRMMTGKYYPKTMWDFNYLDGFLVLYIDKRDFLLEEYGIYRPPAKFYWKSEIKRWFIPTNRSGLHFSINGMNNEEICQRLVELIDIYKKEAEKGRYVDDSCLRNILPAIDFLSLIRD